MKTWTSLLLLLVIFVSAPSAWAGSTDLEREIHSYLADPECTASPLLAAEGDDPGWTFDAALYLWAAGVKGEVTARGVTVPIDVGFDQLFDQLDGAIMIHATGKKDRWGGFVDFAWIGLGAETTGPLGQPATADVDLIFAELAVSYEALQEPLSEEAQFILDVYAGARIYSADVEITRTILSSEQSDSWVDPIIGFGAFVRMDQWQFALRADIGGFGVGSDFAWSLLLGAEYRFSKLFSMGLGYRWLDIDRTSGSGTDEFRLDVQMSGPWLAFVFTF